MKKTIQKTQRGITLIALVLKCSNSKGFLLATI